MSHLRPRSAGRIGVRLGVLCAGGLLAAAGLASPSIASTTTEAPAPTASKISHDEATAMLEDAGITWSSSGGCSDRDVPTCTSFEQVNKETIEGVTAFKNDSGCDVNLTGGTETGHADGEHSHWNGFKLDFAVGGCVDDYITGTYERIEDRPGDGAQQYKAPSTNIYANEGNHWDATYYKAAAVR